MEFFLKKYTENLITEIQTSEQMLWQYKKEKNKNGFNISKSLKTKFIFCNYAFSNLKKQKLEKVQEPRIMATF